MFKQARSPGIRLWHWLDALVIAALLLTVLLRDTLLSPRANAALLRDKLAGAGAEVSFDQARAAARTLVDRLWVWHVDLGYALAALAVLRVAVMVLDGRGAKAGAGAGAEGAASAEARASLHYRLVKAFHRSFYVALAVMVVTGLALAWKDALGLGRSVAGPVHEVHESLMWYVIGFVVLHVAGVVRAEHREDAGLVSGMIHGGGKGAG
jgi:cytochrome b561